MPSPPQFVNTNGPNDQLRHLRESTPSERFPGHALSRTEVAEAMCAYVWDTYRIEAPVERKYVACLERGVIRWPSERYREALRHIFHAQSDAELGFFASRPGNELRSHPPLASAVGEQEFLHLPWTVNGAVRAARILSEVTSMDRRSFMGFSAAAMVELATQSSVARRPATVARPAGAGQQLGQSDIDDIARAGEEVQRLDDRVGGSYVLALAQASLRDITQKLDRCRYTEGIGRQLQAVCAERLRFCGWLCWDVGKHGLADHYFAAALHCAQVAGDNQIAANVHCFMAGLALERNEPEAAMRLAQAGRLRLTGSPLVAAMAHISYAEAAAACGNPEETERAISEAWAAHDRANGTGPGWLYWLDTAHMREMTGRAEARLGHSEAAIENLSAYVDNAAGRERVRGYNFLGLALAGSDEDGACDEAASAGEQAIVHMQDEQVRSPRNVVALRKLDNVLSPYDTTRVGEFRDRLHAYLEAS